MMGWIVRMVPGVSHTKTAATEMAMFTFLSLSGASRIGAQGRAKA